VGGAVVVVGFGALVVVVAGGAVVVVGLPPDPLPLDPLEPDPLEPPDPFPPDPPPPAVEPAPGAVVVVDELLRVCWRVGGVVETVPAAGDDTLAALSAIAELAAAEPVAAAV